MITVEDRSLRFLDARRTPHHQQVSGLDVEGFDLLGRATWSQRPPAWRSSVASRDCSSMKSRFGFLAGVLLTNVAQL